MIRQVNLSAGLFLRRGYLPPLLYELLYSNFTHVAIGDLVISMLVIGPKIRGFKPSRGRWIFKDDKSL
jgi:hypothetical protein